MPLAGRVRVSTAVSTAVSIAMLIAMLIPVALLLALSGCTIVEPAVPPPPPLPTHGTVAELADAVSAQVSKDSTARVAMSGTVESGTPSTLPSGMDVAGVMRVDSAGVSARFVQTVTRSDGNRASTEYISLPTTAYWRVPGSPSARPWSPIGLTGRDDPDDQAAAVVRTITDGVDPTRNLLRYATVTAITAADQTDVDGVRAVRYTLRVDVAAAAANQTDPERKGALEQQLHSGVIGIPYTMWIDEQNRPLRVQTRMQLPRNGTYVMTGSYTDWGAPVEIAAPPAAEIAVT